jgi:nitroimidazol reductase NimA-like FMN-containing flavoprotein (pyridoxamine 5'-phosphate oxidase superfamily)
MFNDEARRLLQKPLIARVSTIDLHGSPHTVPVWFDMDGDDIMIISDRNTRKIDHIARSAKGCVQIGGDTGDGAGYLFKGALSVEVDPDYRWLAQLTRRYEASEQAEKDIELWRTTLDMIVIRLKVKRAIKVI